MMFGSGNDSCNSEYTEATKDMLWGAERNGGTIEEMERRRRVVRSWGRLEMDIR